MQVLDSTITQHMNEHLTNKLRYSINKVSHKIDRVECKFNIYCMLEGTITAMKPSGGGDVIKARDRIV